MDAQRNAKRLRRGWYPVRLDVVTEIVVATSRKEASCCILLVLTMLWPVAASVNIGQALTVKVSGNLGAPVPTSLTGSYGAVEPVVASAAWPAIAGGKWQ